MRPRWWQAPLPGVLLVAAAACAQPASAADPVFAAPRTLALDAGAPAIAIGAGGDAVVAWGGREGGVFVARRGVLGGAFEAPERIADDLADRVRVSRNPAGAIAVAWTGRENPGKRSRLRVSVAPSGGRFGAPETVPLPDAPAVSGSPQAAPTDRTAPAVVLGADGALTAAVTDVEGRLLAGVRAAGGQFGEAQVVATGVRGAPVVAADGLGSTALVWRQEPAANAPDQLRTVVMAAERRPGTGFGTAGAISDPAFGAGAPRVAANARGDMLAAWAVYDTSVAGGNLFPAGADVSERTLGGPWSPARRITTPGRPFFDELTPALNDFGAGVVAGYAPYGFADSVSRPPGATFGAPVQTPVPAGASDGTAPDAVGVDALGTTVHAMTVGGFDRGRVIAVIRSLSGATRVEPLPAGEATSPPALATDPFGNGLVAWEHGGAIRTVTYSALAPIVSALRVGRREFRFRVSEPAVVDLEVRGPKIRARKRPLARQTVIARPAANRVRFAKRVRRLLARRGRHTVVVRTRDAGPVTGRLTTRIRRR